MRILFICGSPMTRVRVAYALRFEGSTVLEARRPQDALELARRSRYDVAIIDHPRGEQLAKDLRALAGWAEVPIVLCMEVVRPSTIATEVWPSPIEPSRAVAMARYGRLSSRAASGSQSA